MCPSSVCCSHISWYSFISFLLGDTFEQISLFMNEYKLNRHGEFGKADESLRADGSAQAEHT